MTFKDSHLDSKLQYESDNVTLTWENFLEKKDVKNRNNTKEECVLISTQRGEWSIADCDEKKPFICEALGTLRSQIEGYTRLLIFRNFSTLPAVI